MLIDGYSMIFQAFYATKNTPMTIPGTGEPTNAVRVFMNMFLAALRDLQPTHCAVAFDMPGPTFRNQLFTEYKANRRETPEDLLPQFSRVRQLMQALAVPTYGVEGYEADDVLGTLSRRAEEHGLPTVILTRDRDLLQVVSPFVRVALSGTGKQERKQYDEIAIAEQYGGLRPHQLADVKALQGDSSDNYKGVDGIGEGSAPKLIQKFGSIAELKQRLDEVEPPRIRELLRIGAANMDLSLQLATIVRDLPLEFDVDKCRFGQYDRERQVIPLLRELGFNNLIERIPVGKPTPLTTEEKETLHQSQETNYKIVMQEEELTALADSLAASGGFAFDTETTSLDAIQAELVGLSFSMRTGEGFYVPLGHSEDGQVPMTRALEILAPVLEHSDIPKTAHNGKYDMHVLANAGVIVRGLAFDTMVAALVLGERALGLKELAFSLIGVEMMPISDLIGKGQKKITFDLVPISQAGQYSAADADMTWRLKELFEGKLQNEPKLWQLFTTLEMPMIPILKRMERHGITLETDFLERLGEELAADLGKLETKLYLELGHQFNIRSPSQVSDVLFQELGLPGGKRTGTGARFSTDASVLEALRTRAKDGDLENADPRAQQVLGAMLEYRELDKLKSTYVDSLPSLVNSKTGRVHTSFNLAGTVTGRLSSSDPNLQNIPVKTEQGRRVRRSFVAQSGSEWKLLSADYSQIELRVLAHLSQDVGLLEAFQRDEDIHTTTASSTYGVPLNAVTPEMRRIAKVMNFGVVYGLSAHGIAQQTELSRAEGAAFIETYFGKYPGILEYLEKTRLKAREEGYTETLLGRRRNLPEMLSSNFQLRQNAERMAVNMPVQGTAAEIIKVAMLQLDASIIEQRLRSRMLLQVHDELIFEAPNDELELLEALVSQLMSQAVELSVPLKVEIKKGTKWGDWE
jgi:DNA polymerase-1